MCFLFVCDAQTCLLLSAYERFTKVYNAFSLRLFLNKLIYYHSSKVID